LNWLDENSFLSRSDRAGSASEITVLSELGTGQTYTKPSENVTRGGQPTYCRLQAHFFTNGWFAALPGRAVLFWLILMSETNDGKAKPFGVWLSQRRTKETFSISNHVRQSAMLDLKNAGLITYRQIHRREAFQSMTSRTQITLRIDQLAQRADDTAS